jgi:hypothetical protein
MDIEVTQQPFDLQMELCELLLDPFFFFNERNGSSEVLESAISREAPQASKFLP